jgi:hypothetical protein
VHVLGETFRPVGKSVIAGEVAGQDRDQLAGLGRRRAGLPEDGGRDGHQDDQGAHERRRVELPFLARRAPDQEHGDRQAGDIERGDQGHQPGRKTEPFHDGGQRLDHPPTGGRVHDTGRDDPLPVTPSALAHDIPREELATPLKIRSFGE